MIISCINSLLSENKFQFIELFAAEGGHPFSPGEAIGAAAPQ